MSRSIIILTLLLLFPFISQSQSGKRLKSQEGVWFVPDAAVVQYAGNMGMLAVGPSYEFANRKIMIDLLYGYVPKFEGTESGHLITAKSTYRPFELQIGNAYTVTPFQVGLGVSYHFGDQYSFGWQEPIPKGYYWWSTSMRVLGFAGTSLSRKVDDSFIKDVGAYAELGTYDLVVTAWYKDEKLGMRDILSASLGVRVRF